MNSFKKRLVIGSTGALMALIVAVPAFAAETTSTTTTPAPTSSMGTTAQSMGTTTAPAMSSSMKVKKVHHKKVAKKVAAKSMENAKNTMMANPAKSTAPAN